MTVIEHRFTVGAVLRRVTAINIAKEEQLFTSFDQKFPREITPRRDDLWSRTAT